MATFRPRPPTLLGINRARQPDFNPGRIHLPVTEAVVDCAIYLDGARLPGKYTPAAAVEKVRELQAQGQPAFSWIGLHEPDEQQMQSVAELFGLHPLAVEDAVHAHQRPKA
jgi:magnesium transporter